MVRHAEPFEAGGKMKIGIWFCHVRLFSGAENNPSADNQIGPSWMLQIVLFNGAIAAAGGREKERAERHTCAQTTIFKRPAICYPTLITVGVAGAGASNLGCHVGAKTLARQRAIRMINTLCFGSPQPQENLIYEV